MLRSNILEAGAASIAELFADYVEVGAGGQGDASEPGGAGAANCIVLALGTAFASPAIRNALERSLEALGYGQEACTYAALAPTEAADPNDCGPTPALDSQALFMLVEGLDPLCVIACDRGAVDMLGKAYRESFEADAPIRVFGRAAVAFADLEEMLRSDSGKQAAWALLKSLPKR